MPGHDPYCFCQECQDFDQEMLSEQALPAWEKIIELAEGEIA